MTRLVLDYYRRWGWVLSLGMALQLIQGWCIAAFPWTPIEFTASMIPVCLGLLPLFDLSRGVVRVVGTLPLSLAKLGRGWWFANVLIPAIVMVALLFLGASAAAFCHPNQAFPLNRLLMASVITVLWLGTIFALVFPAIFPVTGKFKNRWRGILAGFVGGILTFFFVLGAIFAFVLSPGSSNNPILLDIFVAGGTCLTFAGWFRAGRFNPAGIRVEFGQLNPELSEKFYAYKEGAASSRSTPHQPPEGYGGILFLLRTTFMSGLYVYFAGAILILLFAWIEPRFPAFGSPLSLREGFKTKDPTNTVLLIFILFERLTFLMQLRFLRTLPLSTAKLATVIIASVILPVIAAGLFLAGIAGLSVGTTAALTVLKSCILVLAPITLCIFFNVLRGGGMEVFLVSVVVALLAWVWVVSALQHITFPLAAGVAVAGVMLGWRLTYYALSRGSRTYRVQTNPFGRFSSIMGR
jgi:hypothetical protein